jgi:hypothetical protein
MAASFTPELKRILRTAGCSFVRQGKGDHEIGTAQSPFRDFVVDGAIPSRHLANAVLKQAGLPKEF